MMLKRLFASYRRRDGRHVAEIVRLLRVTGVSIFRDADSISPGKRWRAEICEALSNADTVLVFWSENARASEEVRSEYENAVLLEKDVVPILLDGAPLTDILQQFQYIDFRELFLPHSPEGLITHGRQLIITLLERIFESS